MTEADTLLRDLADWWDGVLDGEVARAAAKESQKDSDKQKGQAIRANALIAMGRYLTPRVSMLGCSPG